MPKKLISNEKQANLEHLRTLFPVRAVFYQDEYKSDWHAKIRQSGWDVAYKTQVPGHEFTAWNYICDKCGSMLHAVQPSNWETVLNGIDAASDYVAKMEQGDSATIYDILKNVGIKDLSADDIPYIYNEMVKSYSDCTLVCSAVNEKVEPFLKSLFKEVGVRGCVCEAGWISGNIEIFPE